MSADSSQAPTLPFATRRRQNIGRQVMTDRQLIAHSEEGG